MGRQGVSVMFKKISKWWSAVTKKETKAQEEEIHVPKFHLPGSRERYLQLYQETLVAERKNIMDQFTAITAEVMALLEIETDPITMELHRRKAAKILEGIKPLDMKAMCCRKIVEQKTFKEIQNEEGAKIVAEGIVFNRSFKPKFDFCREERVIVGYEGRIFLLLYFIEPVMKEATDGTKKEIPTGDFLPPKLDWITDSLSQLSTEELGMLKEKNIICNNK